MHASMGKVPDTADVVIIGGGAHGASVAYYLAKKRAGRVVLLEQRFIASGPSGVGTAMVRRYYGMDFLTRTASAAADLFQHWADVIGGGDPGFQQVGYCVLVAAHDEANLKRNVFRARELGAVIAYPVIATRILTRGQRVLGVGTNNGTISAPVVVNCAGLFAARLLQPLGIEIEIKPTRHQMCLFRRPLEFSGHPAVVDRPNGTYMRPAPGDLTLHGVGSYDEIVDPDNYDEGADSAEIRRNATLVARRFPIMGTAAAWGGYAGLYDVTLDAQPVLGAIEQYDGLYADFGWSGHGFKHAPFIGDLISDLILYGSTKDYDLTPFRWSRFQEGDLLPPASWTAPAHVKLRNYQHR